LVKNFIYAFFYGKYFDEILRGYYVVFLLRAVLLLALITCSIFCVVVSGEAVTLVTIDRNYKLSFGFVTQFPQMLISYQLTNSSTIFLSNMENLITFTLHGDYWANMRKN